MNSYKDSFVLGPDNKPITSNNGKDAKLGELLKLFIIQLPRDKINMDDCVHGASIFSALEKISPEETFEISDSDLNWLKEKITVYGPGFLGIGIIKFKETLKI